ncbi:MAG TPA: LysR substrate-binding domain-containing protein [Sphingomonadales bacterium]|nr:LysR substrate-binding domain-containing protein [Sphingomonadales bacterium]
MNLLPLKALRAFEAAARHESFSKAAKELHVTHGAVSKQIKALEEQIGVDLFERVGTGVRLTERGRRLALEATKGFMILENAFEPFVKAQRSVKTVRITTTPSFAARFLAPRLSLFRRNHSDILLQIETTSRLVDFSREGIDAGIRFGPGSWAGVEAMPISAGLVTPVCSPEFLSSFPSARRAQILEAGPVLHNINHTDLQDWFKAARMSPILPMQEYVLEDTNVIIQALLEGQGIALLPKILVNRDLASGKLVQPFGPEIPGTWRYYLVTPSGVPGRKPLHQFREWLLREAKDAEAFRAPIGKRL